MRTSLRAISSSLCRVAFEHHHAADGDRLQLGDRRQRAGAADLDRDVVEGGDRLLGRELVRGRPARRAADEAEAVLQREVVDLVDHAVDVVVEVGALLRQLVVEFERVVQRLGDAGLGIDREAPLLQPVERLGMQLGLVVPALHLAHRIGEELQRPRLGDAGVELAHRAGRGVARVGEHRLAGLLALLVQREEGIVREIDLAADLDQLGRLRILQRVRDAGDMLQVGGDVLADRAVAAGRADGELAVLVAQVGGEAVDLGLDVELDVRLVLAPEEAADACR